MSIMRRGPLDRYPASWVLREAAARSLDGSVEIQSDTPVTIFFDGGHVYAACAGIGGVGVDDHPVGHADEELILDESVDRVVDALCASSGWYYLDLGARHPARGWWRWEVEDVLTAARTRSPDAMASHVLANRRIGIVSSRVGSVTLDEDAWAVVAALASSATSEEIRGRLGWPPARLLRVLTSLTQQGALDPEPAPPRPRAEPADDGPAAEGAEPAVAPVPDLDAVVAELEQQAAARAAQDAAAPEGAEQDRKVDLGAVNNPASHAWMAWNRMNPIPPAPLSATPPYDPQRGAAEQPPEATRPRVLRRKKPPAS